MRFSNKTYANRVLVRIDRMTRRKDETPKNREKKELINDILEYIEQYWVTTYILFYEGYLTLTTYNKIIMYLAEQKKNLQDEFKML